MRKWLKRARTFITVADNYVQLCYCIAFHLHNCVALSLTVLVSLYAECFDRHSLTHGNIGNAFEGSTSHVSVMSDAVGMHLLFTRILNNAHHLSNDMYYLYSLGIIG